MTNKPQHESAFISRSSHRLHHPLIFPSRIPCTTLIHILPLLLRLPMMKSTFLLPGLAFHIPTAILAVPIFNAPTNVRSTTTAHPITSSVMIRNSCAHSFFCFSLSVDVLPRTSLATTHRLSAASSLVPLAGLSEFTRFALSNFP